MKKIVVLPLLIAVFVASQSGVLGQPFQLLPLTAFGTNGDGTIRPGDFPFLTGDGSRYQRGMAYNPTTGHLIIVNRFPPGSETINIIDAATGTNVGTLDLCCPAIGGSPSFAYNMIAVADDGAIYVGNLSTSGTLVQYLLYRWASETNSQTLVYFGDPRNGNPASGSTRWGDTLAVRGSGTNTEVLITTQSGALAAILRPTDDTMATFTATTLVASVPNGGIGAALAFGSGNTFYGKGASASGNALYLMGYDVGAGIATNIHTYAIDQFPGRVGALMVQPASNRLAAVDMTVGSNPDLVRLYDISNPAVPPVFLDRKAVATWTNGNAVFVGAVGMSETNIYGLNSDNGLAAFSIVPGSPGALPPVIFGDPASRLTKISSNVTFSVGVDGTAPFSYQWFKNSSLTAGATNSSLTLTNCQTTDTASYFVVVTNLYGAATSSVAFLTVIPNYGNLVQFDPFPYAPGTGLVGQGGWVLKSPVENGVIEAGSLSVPGLIASSGNRYTYNANNSVRWLFDPPQTNGAIWFSFAMRIDTIGTSVSSETMAGFAQGTTTAFPLKINILGDGVGNTYSVGIYKNSGLTSGAMATNTFTASDTVFVVARMTFRPDTTTDDTCDLWLNPSPATFGEDAVPTPTLADQGAGRADLPYTDGFMWRFSSGYPKRTVDEWRLGYSWADVTPPAPPVLSVTLSGADAVLYWSTNTPPSFKLESIKEIGDLDGWQPVGTTVIVQGGNNTVTVPATAMKLFRLKK